MLRWLVVFMSMDTDLTVAKCPFWGFLFIASRIPLPLEAAAR